LVWTVSKFDGILYAYSHIQGLHHEALSISPERSSLI
jgi:hypothetical protein